MLKSRNPFQWPKMIPNFFSDQRDVETLTKGARSVNQQFSLCVKKIEAKSCHFDHVLFFSVLN